MGTLICIGTGFRATGRPTPDGRGVIVDAGSTANGEATPTCGDDAADLRRRLIESGKWVLLPTGRYRLVEDVEFAKERLATRVISGKSLSAYVSWVGYGPLQSLDEVRFECWRQPGPTTVRCAGRPDQLVLEAGSTLAGRFSDRLTAPLRAERERLVEAGSLMDLGNGTYRLLVDLSPRAASGVARMVLGTNADGHRDLRVVGSNATYGHWYTRYLDEQVD